MVTIIDHPLIKHKLTIMRKEETGTKDFRQNLDEIAGLMVYEVTRNIPLREIEIKTPLVETVGYEMNKEIVIVPILRAGLGFVDGMKNLIPTAKVGHIGIYRDEETKLPCEYLCKLPSITENSMIYIVDPMLATGGSAVKAIDMMKARGAKDITLVCLVGVQEGIDAVNKAHPDVDIYLASKDPILNEDCYIVPGLGDAGDRIFGTK